MMDCTIRVCALHLRVHSCTKISSPTQSKYVNLVRPYHYYSCSTVLTRVKLPRYCMLCVQLLSSEESRSRRVAIRVYMYTQIFGEMCLQTL